MLKNGTALYLAIALAAMAVALGICEAALDLARVPVDPAITDGFRLAVGAAIASLAADRAAYRAQTNGPKA